jgi:hypothetical protein
MPSARAQLGGALGDGGLVEALQPAEVGDVLARGQPLVDAPRVGQHAQAAARGGGVGRQVELVDPHRASLGRHQRVEHAQGGGLACAVGPEQPGDLSIAGLEADPVDRGHLPGLGLERLVQIRHA